MDNFYHAGDSLHAQAQHLASELRFDEAMESLLQAHEADLEEEQQELGLANEQRETPEEYWQRVDKNRKSSYRPGSRGSSTIDRPIGPPKDDWLEQPVKKPPVGASNESDLATTPSSQRVSLSPGQQLLKELREQKVMKERMQRARNPLPSNLPMNPVQDDAPGVQRIG